MKLKIAKEEDRLTVAAILVKNGYKLSQTRKKKDSAKAYSICGEKFVTPFPCISNKEELEKALLYDRGQYDKGYADGRRSALVHGHWKIDEDVYEICATGFTCSVCGKSICSSEMTDNEVLEMMKYCPECGAKMDEEVTDGE